MSFEDIKWILRYAVAVPRPRANNVGAGDWDDTKLISDEKDENFAGGERAGTIIPSQDHRSRRRALRRSG